MWNPAPNTPPVVVVLGVFNGFGPDIGLGGGAVVVVVADFFGIILRGGTDG